jgi:PAS domain S-box-containing protein
MHGPEEPTRLTHAVDGIAASLEARDDSIARRADDLPSDARRFRSVIEHGSDGIVLLDRESRFIYANPSTARLLDCPIHQLIGCSVSEFVHVDDREAVQQRLGELIQNPRTFRTFTFRVKGLNGACRWIEAEGSSLLDDPDVSAIVGRYRDVTDTAQAFEKLSSAVEQSADSVLITDRDGVIEYVNPAFEAMTGYTREEAIGRTPKMLSSGQTPQRVYRALWNTILSGQVFRVTIVNKKKNGQLYDEDQTITPIRDVSGTIKHFVSTGRDITQRKRTEEALRRLNAQLEKEATRIAGVLHDEAGQFLMSAHIALAEMAREANPAMRERLQWVRANLDQVEEQLRRLSREIHPRILNDMGLVEAIKFRSQAFGRRAAIRVDVIAKFDAQLDKSVEAVLYRLVQEGLTNISRHARATEACVELSNDDVTVTCAIRDNGQGFDAEAVLAGRADGSLGLQLIRDRLAACGGTLIIRSSSGAGTELRATLPVEG